MEHEGWEAELRCYEKDMPADVSLDTDIIEWWQVCPYIFIKVSISLNLCQDHCNEYPTLARIALDVLPIPASSVPCERLFSAAKEVTDDHHSHLGLKKFEETQVMKFAWHNNIPNLAAWNSNEVEEINITEYTTLLSDDNWQANFDGSESADIIAEIIEQQYIMMTNYTY